ncbi:hypothetical protein ON010_g2117 [Phytophthora cinnamomi]|nr:hypothetical protein ON010_g2117 [Phytophthora cinnamomi]
MLHFEKSFLLSHIRQHSLTPLVVLLLVIRVRRRAFVLFLSRVVGALGYHADEDPHQQEAPPDVQAVQRREQHVEEQPRRGSWVGEKLREVVRVGHCHAGLAILHHRRVEQLGRVLVDTVVEPENDRDDEQDLAREQAGDAFNLEVVGHLEHVKRDIRHIMEKQHDHTNGQKAYSVRPCHQSDRDDVVGHHDQVILADLLQELARKRRPQFSQSSPINPTRAPTGSRVLPPRLVTQHVQLEDSHGHVNGELPRLVAPLLHGHRLLQRVPEVLQERAREPSAADGERGLGDFDGQRHHEDHRDEDREHLLVVPQRVRDDPQLAHEQAHQHGVQDRVGLRDGARHVRQRCGDDGGAPFAAVLRLCPSETGVCREAPVTD